MIEIHEYSDSIHAIDPKEIASMQVLLGSEDQDQDSSLTVYLKQGTVFSINFSTQKEAMSAYAKLNPVELEDD